MKEVTVTTKGMGFETWTAMVPDAADEQWVKDNFWEEDGTVLDRILLESGIDTSDIEVDF